MTLKTCKIQKLIKDFVKVEWHIPSLEDPKKKPRMRSGIDAINKVQSQRNKGKKLLIRRIILYTKERIRVNKGESHFRVTTSGNEFSRNIEVYFLLD